MEQLLLQSRTGPDSATCRQPLHAHASITPLPTRSLFQCSSIHPALAFGTNVHFPGSLTLAGTPLLNSLAYGVAPLPLAFIVMLLYAQSVRTYAYAYFSIARFIGVTQFKVLLSELVCVHFRGAVGRTCVSYCLQFRRTARASALVRGDREQPSAFP